MEISAKKTKLMTNNTSGISTEIKVNGQKFETATNLKYLGSFITCQGFKPKRAVLALADWITIMTTFLSTVPDH